MASKLPSLEELLSHITKETLEQPCSDEDTVAIAGEITNWQVLAPLFGLTSVDEENILQNNHSVQLQRREMLRTWKQHFGSKATYGTLAEALYKAKRVDLVEKVIKLLREKATGTS